LYQFCEAQTSPAPLQVQTVVPVGPEKICISLKKEDCIMANQTKSSLERYQEIKDKAKVECVGAGYAHTKYRVLENPESLSTYDLALICAKGNLCFGYRVEGDLIVIHED